MTTSPTHCRCGPDGCADSSCPGRRTLSPAEALDAMRHQLDPVDDWREPLERAAAELRRLADLEGAYVQQGRDLTVMCDAYDQLAAARGRLVNLNRTLRAELRRLAAEVEALRADAERLDSGCILTQERDEFGEPYQRITTGIDLRAAIDAAKASAA